MIKIHLAAAWLVMTSPSFAEEGPKSDTAFDPSGYLQEREYQVAQEQAAKEVKTANVVIGGVPYVKLEAKSGAIYVPKLTGLTPEDLDKALCSGSFKAGELESATVSAAELAVTQKVQLYAKLIVDTIHTKCDGSQPRPAPAMVGPGGLEVGAKVQGDGRNPTTYSIFNSNLAPNIGVRADF